MIQTIGESAKISYRAWASARSASPPPKKHPGSVTEITRVPKALWDKKNQSAQFLSSSAHRDSDDNLALLKFTV
jgi:hypothetical protein